MFSAIFTMGNNFCDFLSVSLGEESLLKRGLLLQEKSATREADFALRVDPN